tara:strand:+ start:1016 stop:1540 length:525 start_codon:yes stop_codon:yes gene_type:complete
VRVLIIITVSLLFLSASGYGQGGARKAVAAQKAIYFYSFATQVDWPEKFKSGNFVIGVYGDKELFQQLVSKLSSSKRGSQPFKIVEFNSPDDIGECHILYVDETKSDVISSKRKILKTNSTLVITSKKGVLVDGSIINFVYPSNRTMFELSKSNATKSKLVIGKQISSLAVEVQ